ncbi:hypothetical protein WMF38_43925 [Sorangium sp. So ce118]
MKTKHIFFSFGLLFSGIALWPHPAHATTWAWARTPSIQGSDSYEQLHCVNCAANTPHASVQWATLGTGEYSLLIPNGAPYPNRYLLHATAFGTPGVTCTPASAISASSDAQISVFCTDSWGNPINSRFELVYKVMAPGPFGIISDAFARNWGSSISVNNSWSSSGLQPEFVRRGVGQYTFRFPGITGTTTGGNAQATSRFEWVNCSIDNWVTMSTGTDVNVSCYDKDLDFHDTDVFVSYTQHGTWVWSSNQGVFTTYTPNLHYNQVSSGSSNEFTIERTDTGEYTVRGSVVSDAQSVLVTPYASKAECVLMAVDDRLIKVKCTSHGLPVDSAFSLRANQQNLNASADIFWDQITSVNFTKAFDAGYGLICGTGAVPATDKQVLCVRPAGAGDTTDVLPAGGAAFPNSIRSIAIDNVDGTATRILVLGSDNVVRVINGDLRLPWLGNFASYSTYAEPILMPTGEPVSLKKIVAIRTTGEPNSQILGLSTDNRILWLFDDGSGNRRWAALSLFPIPSGVTWKDISHGVVDLFLLSNDGRMYRSEFGGVSAVQLPGLPLGYKPIAMGGTFVMSDAGKNGSGSYPCSGPADSYGYYDCAGDDKRFFQLRGDNTWYDTVGYAPLPTTDREAALTSGNPFAQISPTVVDAEIFAGSSNHFLAWQYNSRIYQWRW